MSTGRPIVNLGRLPQDDLALQPLHRPGPAQAVPLAGYGWRIRQLLAPEELASLRKLGQEHCTTAVGRDGILSNYRSGDAIGSYRSSVFAPQLAELLWQRLEVLPWPQSFDSRGFTDWAGHRCWGACGVNPLLRFIQYRAHAGQLIGHYDAPYVESENRRTLFSLLLYLTDNPKEGATRFLRDSQCSLPFEQRDFSDWDRAGHSEEVIFANQPIAGDAVVFEHRLLHDSSPLTRGMKLVVRSDVFFEKR